MPEMFSDLRNNPATKRSLSGEYIPGFKLLGVRFPCFMIEILWPKTKYSNHELEEGNSEKTDDSEIKSTILAKIGKIIFWGDCYYRAS